MVGDDVGEGGRNKIVKRRQPCCGTLILYCGDSTRILSWKMKWLDLEVKDVFLSLRILWPQKSTFSL